MPKEPTDLAVRKKMRKGTHSCFECRRRKIRCIFPADNPDVCSECFARGSRCIDQENANPEIVVDHRKNLRERVSRLEALVDSLLEEKTERSVVTETTSSKTPNLLHKDTFPPTPLSSDASSAILQNNQRAPSGHHIPLLSVFEDALNDAEERIKARMPPTASARKESIILPGASTEDPYTVTCVNDDDIADENSVKFKVKKERAKEALVSVLPPVDQLNKVLNSNGDWWETWRKKCSGTSDSGETLAQFALKALTDGNIGAIGTVVLSVAICSADEADIDRYIETVDRWVLSDDEYAATLEGMECLILKAKWYADVGQPRRAWLGYRKGLMYCQMMGLHRKRTTSAAHESIWWSLYHGDRFLSLLLGLPYGIRDDHCDLRLPEMGGEYLAPLVFMNKISQIAGRVIDRNQGQSEQSFAWALQLDQELEDLWKQLDPTWLEYTHLMADIEKNAADLRERLMAQMVYHQIRVYLHLPFMLKSQTNSRFTYSRTACLTGSREVLRLYQALRTGEVQPLYECKAVDFIGFTSAVLIMLGLCNYGNFQGRAQTKDQEEDMRLIEASIDIFRRASSEKGGKVALQSAQVLERMLKQARVEWGQEKGVQEDFTEFVIPYFGTISIKRGNTTAKPPDPSLLQQTPSIQQQQQQHHKQSISSNSSTSQQQFTPSTETSDVSFMFPNLSAHHQAQQQQQHQQHQQHSHSQQQQQQTPTNPNAPASRLTFTNSDPLVSYEGFYNWPGTTADDATNPLGTTHLNDDTMNSFPLPTNNFSWQNMPMDIDQDWSWFLNDNASPPAGGNGAQGGQVGDQFAQQSYLALG